MVPTTDKNTKMLRVITDKSFYKILRLKASYKPFDQVITRVADFTVMVCGDEQIFTYGNNWTLNFANSKGQEVIDTRRWISSSIPQCPASISIVDPAINSTTRPIATTNGPFLTIDTSRIRGVYNFTIIAENIGSNPAKMEVRTFITLCGNE